MSASALNTTIMSVWCQFPYGRRLCTDSELTRALLHRKSFYQIKLRKAWPLKFLHAIQKMILPLRFGGIWKNQNNGYENTTTQNAIKIGRIVIKLPPVWKTRHCITCACYTFRTGEKRDHHILILHNIKIVQSSVGSGQHLILLQLSTIIRSGRLRYQ